MSATLPSRRITAAWGRPSAPHDTEPGLPAFMETLKDSTSLDVPSPQSQEKAYAALQEAQVIAGDAESRARKVARESGRYCIIEGRGGRSVVTGGSTHARYPARGG